MMDFKKMFGKKRPEEEIHPKDNGMQDFMTDEEEDDKNDFLAAEDSIEFEQDAAETRGRTLKKNVIIGGIVAAAAVGGMMIFSDSLFPSSQEQEKPPEVRTSSVNPMGAVPSNYQDLAKFDKQRELKEREQAMLEQRKREEAEKAKREAEGARPAAAVDERRPVREVEVPRASAPRVSPPTIGTPSVPSIGGGSAARSRDESGAITSSIGFSVGGEREQGGIFGIYSAASSSRVNMRSAHVVNAGTIIPSVLLSGIDSRATTMVTAQVRQDVYDTLTGTHLIIPQGSRLIGKMEGGRGRRAVVAFERILLPDGSSITLPAQNAVDNQGYGGMKDKYDTHEPDFYRGALIAGLMAYVSDVVDDKLGNNSGVDSNGNSYSSALSDTVEEITDHIMDRADQTEAPTIVIRQGYQFNVMLTEDMTGYEFVR